MDNLDRQLKNIFKERQVCKIPKKTQKIIDNTLENLHKKNNTKFNVKYKIAGICAVVLLTTTVVFAKDIKNIINNVFNYENTGKKGIQTAVNNGYIQNTNMDYIESNGTKFKIDYIAMDDSALALNFNFLLDESAEGFEGISFYDMKIYDDNDNLIYTEVEKYPNESIALGIGIVKPILIEGNNIIQSFLIESDRFPKTKTIRITFKKITLYNVNKGNPITKEISGDFDIKLDIEEKFYNRETIEYKIEKVRETKDIKLDKVFVTDTSFNIIINDIPVYDFAIDLKDSKGNIYNIENLFFHNVNDETGRKIAKLDFTKYNIYEGELKLIIKGKLEELDSEIPIFINESDYVTENGMSVYNVNQNSKRDKESIPYTVLAEYVLKK